jgi:hypothetical protein
MTAASISISHYSTPLYEIAEQGRAEIDTELANITAGEIDSVHQVGRLLEWLNAHGAKLKNIGKNSLEKELTNGLPEAARRVIQLRLDGAHAAANKLDTMRAWLNGDSRVRGTLKFHGASTGRWSSYGIQLQNLKKPIVDDIDQAMAAVASGSLEHLRKDYPQPMSVVGDVTRAMICAAPGHRLIAGDLSGIESRVTAWVSGQQSKLDMWAKFDRTGEPKDEPYYLIGRMMGIPEEKARAIGKVADLAFGYQGGVGAWRKLAPDDPAPDEHIKRLQYRWHDAHPHTKLFWKTINDKAVKAVRTPLRKVQFQRPEWRHVAFESDGSFLFMHLPSGRKIACPQPCLRTDPERNTVSVVFMDTGLRGWSECRNGFGAYGGTWIENAVQAIARDIIAEGMIRLEAAGYPVVLHVHDEIVAECSDGFGSVEEFQKLVATVPPWAEGLPITAKVRNGPRFSKSEAAQAKTPETPWDGLDIPGFLRRESVQARPDEKIDPRNETANSAEGVDGIAAEQGEALAPAPDILSLTDEDLRSDEDHTTPKPDPPKSGGYGYAQQDAGKPYAPTRNRLLRQGYQITRTFPYTLPGGKVLYSEDRYELRSGITPSERRPRKTSRFWHEVNGMPYNNTGPRRVLYNWQAILEADREIPIHITEGPNKSAPLITRDLLGTAVAYHNWAPECVDGLRGRHLIYHEDHDPPDKNGEKPSERFSADARKNLAPVAASFRIVPAAHLWKHLPPGSRAIGPRDDVKDWLELGGDAAKLLDICREIPADSFELDEWDAGELLNSGLPEPRQWLMSRQFCRGFLSGLVAPGDVGKTTLRLTQAVELACGRELLGLRIYQRCRVLVVSLEDDRRELHRRLLAICRHHRINPAELTGWLFCRELNGIKLAKLNNKGGRELGELDHMLRGAIERRRPDLVVLDPFVKLHALNENDNPDMDFVCSHLVRLAQDHNIAVDSPAHTHKGAIVAGDADARRGASAQRDAGRLDYTLTAMSEEEANRFGIDADERKSYVRLDRAKANLVRAIKAMWFRLVSVPLGNATARYPEGDDMQAIETWVPPDAWQDLDARCINQILDKIEAGMPDGNRYSGARSAKKRAAWQIFIDVMPEKNEAQAREIIKTWLKEGLLVSREYENPADRKKAEGLYVNPTKRPTM